MADALSGRLDQVVDTVLARGDATAALSDAEPGTFYLTDFLLRHFDRLVMQGLGIDRHPELLTTYFGNYRRLVYLGQAPGAQSDRDARAVAQRLGLEYHYQSTGYGGLGKSLAAFNDREQARQWPA